VPVLRPRIAQNTPNWPQNRKFSHFLRQDTNFLDSNPRATQNEGVEQGDPPYGAQGAAGDR